MFSQFSLRTKLRLINLVAIFALIVVGASAIQEKRNTMMDGIRHQLRDQMSIVFTMFDYYRAQAEVGNISREEAQKRALDQLRNIRYQDREFFSVGTMEPVMLMHPAVPALEGKNFGALRDKNGKAFIQEMVTNVQRDGSAYVEYWWPKAGEETPSPKLSFARNYAAWDWLVNTGVYIDNINRQFYRDTAWFIAILAIVSVLVTILSTLLGRGVVKALDEILTGIRTVARTRDLSQRFNTGRKDEFGELGRGFQDLLGSLSKAEADLLEHRDSLQQVVADRTQELVLAKELAERANAAKTRFVSEMSHELRTPMHAILSFATLGEQKSANALKEALTPDSVEKLMSYFQRIRTSGDRLLKLLNDLLDITKLEAGRMELQLQKMDLVQNIQQALSEFDAQLQAKQLRIVIAPPNGKTTIFADEFRIGQVVRNLLSNAIKFSPKDSRITIVLRPAPTNPDNPISMIELVIADEGKGIPQGELETIFEKFSQSSSNQSSDGGTGLGLPICREITLAHGGEIFARHREPKGSEFVIRLPQPQSINIEAPKDGLKRAATEHA